jgi:glucokinase
VVNIPSWQRVPLKELLEKEFEVPVSVNNDVNCFALGEHQFGLAQGIKHVVCVSAGTGLGAGIIINHQLFNGNNCGAGEIGLLPYLDHNIEYYASGNLFFLIPLLKRHTRKLYGEIQKQYASGMNSAFIWAKR